MNEPIAWQGSKVDVYARLVPRFLWSTASIDVFLDRKCILRTGGQLKPTGSHSATFSHSGSEHRAELFWGAGFLWSFPYELQIDGNPVSEGRVYVRNWPVGLLIPILIAAALLALLHFVRHVPRPDETIERMPQLSAPAGTLKFKSSLTRRLSLQREPTNPTAEEFQDLMEALSTELSAKYPDVDFG
jgi:hypothetical protein